MDTLLALAKLLGISCSVGAEELVVDEEDARRERERERWVLAEGAWLMP